MRAAGGPGKRSDPPVRFLRGVAAYARISKSDLPTNFETVQAYMCLGLAAILSAMA